MLGTDFYYLTSFCQQHLEIVIKVKVIEKSECSHELFFSCVHCRAHLASQVNLISKSFQGSQGRAYLFDSVVNIASGPAEQRVLLTGLHHVADIHCQR